MWCLECMEGESVLLGGEAVLLGRSFCVTYRRTGGGCGTEEEEGREKG